MNCDEFQRRMDWLLDQHLEVQSDGVLASHTAECPACAETVRVWSQIDDALGYRSSDVPADHEGHHHARPSPNLAVATRSRRLHRGVAALASAAVILLLASPHFSGTERPTESADVTFSAPAGEVAAAWTADEWWSTVGSQDWVQSTMPAMDSVRQGVAPIGRSMKQAVAILMSTVDETGLPTGSEGVSPPNSSKQTTRTTKLLSQGTVV